MCVSTTIWKMTHLAIKAEVALLLAILTRLTKFIVLLPYLISNVNSLFVLLIVSLIADKEMDSPKDTYFTHYQQHRVVLRSLIATTNVWVNYGSTGRQKWRKARRRDPALRNSILWCRTSFDCSRLISYDRILICN